MAAVPDFLDSTNGPLYVSLYLECRRTGLPAKESADEVEAIFVELMALDDSIGIPTESVRRVLDSDNRPWVRSS